MAHQIDANAEGRALVIGASLAGLTSARVLSDHFREVVIVERDRLPHGPVHRRHVPQSPHAHGLLGSGRNALCALFPGWIEDLRAHGAPTGPDQPEIAEKVGYLMRGQYIIESPSWWLGGVAASRVLLEHTLRERVRALPNVRFVEETRVLGLLMHKGRVAGLDTTQGPLASELVVDASGRRSQLWSWFAELGYRPPSISIVHSSVQYASCLLEAEPDFDPAWLTLLGADESEGGARGIAMLPIENGRYHCTFSTIASGARIPDQPDEFLAWGHAFSNRAVREALGRMRVVSKIERYSVPSNRFIHYDKMRAHPEGVIALGDAVCAFNPVYGQGMSVAALSALALRRELQRGKQRRDFARASARAIAEVVRPAWSLSVREDLRLGCRTEGLRGRALYRLGEPYSTRLVHAASRDPEVALALTEVVHLVRSPAVLFAPRIVARVMRTRAQPRAPIPNTSPTRATRHLFEVPPQHSRSEP